MGISIIHERAEVHPTAKIGNFVTIKADVVIEEGAIIEDGARIYENCVIRKNSIIGSNAVLRPKTHIGDNSIFGSGSVSEGENRIGRFTTVHAQCHITKGMFVGDNVFIAPFFCQANTPDITKGQHGRAKMPYVSLEGTIKDGVRIGIGVMVAPGITIGEDSLIDPACYITKNVPPNSHVRADKAIVGRVVGNA